MQRRVLVTGGAGFIGSHVVETLVGRGWRPVVLDNLASGSLENLREVQDQVEFHEGDIRDADRVRDLMEGVDACVHLAAEPSVALSVEKPRETHETNYVGTLNVLEAARHTKVWRVVYASSAAVYPPDNPLPHAEGNAPDPSSPYGLDKLAGEYALRAYGRLYGIEGTALRFFNIYGERQNPRSPYSGVISIFMDRLSQGLPITIHGTGKQVRDFVYVRDLARLISDLVEHGGAPSVMNVGTGVGTTLLELVETIEKVVGRSAQVTLGPPRPGDILVSTADVSLLAQNPARLPRTTLFDGLRALFVHAQS